MITITQAQLMRAVPNLNKEKVNEFVASFNMYSVHFGLTTKRRVVHYLAQIFHESGALSATSENMNYSADGLMKTFPKYFDAEKARQYARQPEKIANYVYGGRMGNGNENTGDGWRFRGRGYIGLTGRQNYSDFNSFDLCTVDVLKNPDKVASYPLNQICAMWFWERYGLNAVADTDTGGSMSEQVVERITRKVNGGYLGLAQRKYYYKRFAREFGL